MDRAVDLLKLLRGKSEVNGMNCLQIVKAVTTDPNPVTFVFEGTELAIDSEVFEIPVSTYPVCVGDRFLAAPLIMNGTNRFGIISKINNAAVVGTMVSASSCTVSGIGRPYTSADLIIPSWVADDGSGRKLKAGDTVLLVPTKIGVKIKYAVVQHF